ncbi:MAG: LexA family protein [Verrucomicrobiales bacterium]
MEEPANGKEGAKPSLSAHGDVAEGDNSSNLDLQRLRKARKQLRLTQADLANLLGIHRTYLVLIEKGKKIPSSRLGRTINEFIEQAESKNGEVAWPKHTPGNAALSTSAAPTRKVPVVSWAAAGLARDYEELRNHIDEMVETDCKDPDAFSIIIEGDSMEHKFFAGDRVVFAPHLEPRNQDAVVARLNDGRVFFKYFFRTGSEGGRVKLVSENQNYSPMEFDRSEFQFIYPAWEVKRRLRR